MKEIGVGIVGYGFMGKTHTYAYQTIPLYYDSLPFRSKLIGVCNRTLEKAQKAKEEIGFSFATDHFDELLQNREIEAVHICTPNIDHKEMAMKALAAGKHVYCDKPLAANAREAKEMAQAARRAGVTAQVALQNRFFPGTMRAKQLIEEGKLGKILSFRGEYLHSGSVDRNKPMGWKQDAALAAGGVVFDLGAHILDLLSWMIGPFREILAETTIAYAQRPDKTGVFKKVAAEDQAMLLLRTQDGAPGSVEVSKIATGTNDELSFTIYGEKGAISYNSMEPNWLNWFDNTVLEAPLGGVRGSTRIECVQRYPAPGGSFPSPKMSIGWLRGHVHSVYSFLNNIYEGKPGSPSFEEGAYIQQVMEAAYTSAKNRTWVVI